MGNKRVVKFWRYTDESGEEAFLSKTFVRRPRTTNDTSHVSAVERIQGDAKTDPQSESQRGNFPRLRRRRQTPGRIGTSATNSSRVPLHAARIPKPRSTGRVEKMKLLTVGERPREPQWRPRSPAREYTRPTHANRSCERLLSTVLHGLSTIFPASVPALPMVFFLLQAMRGGGFRQRQHTVNLRAQLPFRQPTVDV